jgi:hypothetical protein
MRLLLALSIASALCFAQSSEVIVRSNPSDAEVSINGNVVGRTPLSVPMHGVHLPFSLAVNKSGFDTWYVQTVSEPGKSVINAELQSSGFTVERADTQLQHPKQADPEPVALSRPPAPDPLNVRPTPDAPFANSSEEEVVLHEGTPVRMRINRTVSSATATEGDNVDFETLDDIKLNGSVVIPAGSTAMGTVTQAMSKRHMGKGGKLDMNIDYVRMPNGEKLPLRGVENLKGGGHGGAMTGGMVATAIVFWPAAPLFLFVHGKDISVPKGHEITVYTNSDYKTVQMVQARKVEKSVTASALLTNGDVLKLKQAGFSEELILARVKTSPGDYQLGTDALMDLRKAGLSDAVLGAMMAAPKQ